VELVGKILVTGGQHTGGKWSRDECVSISLHRIPDCVVFGDAFFMPIEPAWTHGVRHRIDIMSNLALMEVEWSEWI